MQRNIRNKNRKHDYGDENAWIFKYINDKDGRGFTSKQQIPAVYNDSLVINKVNIFILNSCNLDLNLKKVLRIY